MPTHLHKHQAPEKDQKKHLHIKFIVCDCFRFSDIMVNMVKNVNKLSNIIQVSEPLFRHVFDLLTSEGLKMARGDFLFRLRYSYYHVRHLLSGVQTMFFLKPTSWSISADLD